MSFPGGGDHRAFRELYRELMRLRKELSALRCLDREHTAIKGLEAEQVLVLRRWSSPNGAAAIFHFGRERGCAAVSPAGRWCKILDSGAAGCDGPGRGVPAELRSEGRVPLSFPPLAFVVSLREEETVT